MTTINIQPVTEDGLRDKARLAAEFLEFALGPDVHIGIGDGFVLTVTPASQEFTISWDMEGVIGWTNTSLDLDVYEILRQGLFGFDMGEPVPADIEDNVMALGDAVGQSVVDLVNWVDWQAHRAIDEIRPA
jgi:hypothetical protein